MDQTTSARFLSTKDAASYCCSAPSTFEKYRISGKGGPTYIKLGRRVVYDRADLDRWLTANRHRSTSEAA